MEKSHENVGNRQKTSGRDSEGEKDCKKLYFMPESLSRAIQIREKNKFVHVIAGGTDILVENFERLHEVKGWLDLNRIDELRHIAVGEKEIKIGSMVTHEKLNRDPAIGKFCPLLSQAAGEVGSLQIRSRGTLGGNIVTSSPAGDTLAPLLAHRARFVLTGIEGSREIAAEDFFTGPKENVLRPDELLSEIIIPRPSETERFYWEKVGKRQAMIISSVTVALAVELDDNQTIIRARPCYGAVAPTPLLADQLAEFMQGQRLADIDTFQAGEIAAKNVSPIDDIRGTESYRRDVVKDITKRGLETIKRREEAGS